MCNRDSALESKSCTKKLAPKESTVKNGLKCYNENNILLL